MQTLKWRERAALVHVLSFQHPLCSGRKGFSQPQDKNTSTALRDDDISTEDKKDYFSQAYLDP